MFERFQMFQRFDSRPGSGLWTHAGKKEVLLASDPTASTAAAALTARGRDACGEHGDSNMIYD